MTIEDVAKKLKPKIENEVGTGAFVLQAGVSKTQDVELIADIFFDYVEEETKSGQANITDNYVEGNYAIQDHIALSPKTYRLKGYVGEMLYRVPTDFYNNVTNLVKDANTYIDSNKALSKLRTIYRAGNALSPIVGSYTQTAMNLVDQVHNSFLRYQQIYNRFKGNISEFEDKRQNTVNSILFYLMDARVPVKINGLIFERTSGKEYTSQYFIQSVQAHQGDSRYISDFEIILKELRTVENQTTNISEKTLKEANAIQTTDTAYNGKSSSMKVDDTTAKTTTAERGFQKATTISANQNDTPLKCIQSYTAVIKEEIKAWDKQNYNGYFTNVYRAVRGR